MSLRSTQAVVRSDVQSQAAGGRWTAHPQLVLRMAGFPVELLAPLTPEGMRERLRELELAVTDLLGLRGRLLGLLGRLRRQAPSAETVAQGRRIERYVRRNRAVSDSVTDPELAPSLRDWNLAVKRLTSSEEACWECRSRGEQRIQAGLVALATNQPFLDAVFVNSPSALEGVSDYPRSRRQDQRRLITGYLQRFTTKAETASFFGPSNFVRAVGEDGSAISFARRRAGQHAQRRAFMSYWAAQAIGDCMRSGTWPGAHLRLYRNARSSSASMAQAVSTPLERILLEAADGSISIGGLARRLALPLERIGAVAAELERRGLLRSGLVIPTACPEPLAALRDLVEGEDLNPESRALIDFFQDWLRRFEVAGLEERRALLEVGERRFLQETGLQPRRAPGRFQADRFLYVEEAWGNLSEGRMGKAWLDQMATRLQPVLDLVASEAIEARLAGRDLLLPAASAEGGAAVALIGHAESPALKEVRARRVQRWARMIPDPSVPQVELSSDILRDHGLIRRDLDNWPLFCAPDVMLAADAAGGGSGSLVLAEVHHILPPLSLPFRFLPGLDDQEGERLVSELEAAFGGTRLMLSAVERDTKAMDYTPLGMATLCLDYLRGEAGARPVAVGEATVDMESLVQPLIHAGGEAYSLLPQYEDFQPSVGLLGEAAVPGLDLAPLEMGRHTPRVVIDGVVYQRESWLFEREDFSFAAGRGERELLASLWRFKAVHRLPDAVYARVSAEDKPFFVDWASPDLCLYLAGQLRTAHQLRLTEALPSPNELWLSTDSGRHCCELRLTMYRRRPASGGQSG
jgi:hypothetical protein